MTPAHDDVATQMPRMKVLHTAETALGGVGTYIDFLCEATPDVENTLLIPQGHTELIKPARNISTFPYPKRGFKTIVAHCRKLLKVHDQQKPDIVFFHSTFALFPLLVLSIFRPKTKTLYCAHGWAASQYETKSPLVGRIVALIEGRLAGRADRTINISHFDRRIASGGNYRGQHVTIENAVPDVGIVSPNEHDSIDPEKVNLLFVGRHDTQKGLDILLEAFRIASAKRPDLALHVIGAAVRTDGAGLTFPDNVHALGWVEPDEINTWYAAMDAIVVPSRWEGFGLVVAEAFRNGTPALVSRRGALPDLVGAGETGEVFDLEVEVLVEVLCQVSKSNLNGYRMACRQAYEQRFSQDRFSKEVRKTYVDVTSAVEE